MRFIAGPLTAPTFGGYRLSVEPIQHEFLRQAGGRFGAISGCEIVAHFGDPVHEYEVARTGVGLYPALDRGMIEVTGVDRAAWLHNLTTNAVRDLQPGDGNYAFAVNLKGRILFDLNVLVCPGAIRLDLHRRALPVAWNHFNRYLITEDVTLEDMTASLARFALVGPRAPEVAAKIGLPHAAVMAQLGPAFIDLLGKRAMVYRHEFAGVFGLEIGLPAELADEAWSHLLEVGRPADIRPVGRAALRTLRIEAGIPAWGEEIDEEVLPAETLQLDRAVSFNKGCYLGHEVIERLRSHHALPRKLVGLRLSQLPAGAASPISIRAEDKTVGRLMSFCHSPAVGAPVGLGYLVSACAHPGTTVLVATDPPIHAQVTTLPFQSVK